ncbi:helix-turn-helix domain-containing protein [Anabaena sp. UHCC 0253]|uniref:GIY-YIG nuclease family protein n=1 Tax=Anabaena sp. UHCC 0253 TaxID=2590019 RepID=UPI0014454113|nr:GIY-YIG nuclease family protein [Anabaena sp. UHCC 0253]MTJ52945.1 helix-turn-helix domain-containing protein [Anabaena sp. UHCC 0253]
METTGSIYIIKNIINAKVYIGQTLQPVVERFKQHLKLLKTNRSQTISKAIAKYGKDKFYYEVLEESIPLDQLDQREEFYIQKYDSISNGYNLCPGCQKWRKKPLNLPEDEIANLYIRGYSSRHLGQMYKVSAPLIQKIVRKQGLSRAKQHNLPDRSSKVTKDILLELYVVQRLSQRTIARRLGVHEETVRRAVKRHNLQKI